MNRHIERVENKLRSQVVCHCPADDTATENIEHDGNE